MSGSCHYESDTLVVSYLTEMMPTVKKIPQVMKAEDGKMVIAGEAVGIIWGDQQRTMVQVTYPSVEDAMAALNSAVMQLEAVGGTEYEQQN
jgi:hypothetical protein